MIWRKYLLGGAITIVVGALLWINGGMPEPPTTNAPIRAPNAHEETPPAQQEVVQAGDLRWGSQPPTAPITGTTWTDTNFDVTLVYIPAGPFTMGSVDGQVDEQPEHVVTLDAFWIMQTEVTNAQYRLCVETGVCKEPFNAVWNREEFAKHPVTHVTWDQAVGYAEWIGGRLPTEAEWEKVARGSDKRFYPWGNFAPDEQLLNYNRYVEATVPVGSYPAGVSPYGAHDMAGNVWEWVADWYALDAYANSPAQNPTGPGDGAFHVLRGGSWRTNGETTRTFTRFREPPYGEVEDVGIRVVRGPVP